jgi:hypothetical protein
MKNARLRPRDAKGRPDNLVYLQDRSADMLKKDLILKNPLRALEPETGPNAAPSRMGLVIARRGVGKTAMLVQFALDSLLRGNRVLHVSIGQKLEKTKAWYEDLFEDLSRSYRLDHAGQVHDEIARNRLIMTFKATAFSGPKLEERLNDLLYQDIFRPECMVIDGYDFESATCPQVQDLLDLTQAMSLHTWFSAVRHREDPRTSELGVPVPCDKFEDLFDTILLLDPEEKGIALRTLKDEFSGAAGKRKLILDPATFLVSQG